MRCKTVSSARIRMHIYKSTDRFAALLPRTSLPCFTRKICRWQSVNSERGAEPPFCKQETALRAHADESLHRGVTERQAERLPPPQLPAGLGEKPKGRGMASHPAWALQSLPKRDPLPRCFSSPPRGRCQRSGGSMANDF